MFGSIAANKYFEKDFYIILITKKNKEGKINW